MRVYVMNPCDGNIDWIPEVLRNNRIANALRVVMATDGILESELLAIANSMGGYRSVDWRPFRVHTRDEIFHNDIAFRAAVASAVRQQRRQPRRFEFKSVDARAAFHAKLSSVSTDSRDVRTVHYRSVPIGEYVWHLTDEQLARGLGELERHVDYIFRADAGRRRADIERRMYGYLFAAYPSAERDAGAAQLFDLVSEAADKWMDAIGKERRRRVDGGLRVVCEHPRDHRADDVGKPTLQHAAILGAWIDAGRSDVS